MMATFADEVISRTGRSKPGFKTWFDRLPDDVQRELEEAKSQFNPAIHQKRAYCKAIMEAARDRGWETAGIQGVIAWLTRR
jgi:hypothetical protein